MKLRFFQSFEGYEEPWWMAVEGEHEGVVWEKHYRTHKHAWAPDIHDQLPQLLAIIGWVARGEV